jgi:hypothetical protein
LTNDERVAIDWIENHPLANPDVRAKLHGHGVAHRYPISGEADAGPPGDWACVCGLGDEAVHTASQMPQRGARKQSIIMGTTKVGIYRSYHGPEPVDETGQSLPKSEWPKKRPFSWVVRWFGSDGNRYSKSFEGREEAERFAETKQNEVRQGNGDRPRSCTLREFYAEHRVLSKGSMSRNTLIMQLSTIRLLATRTGWERDLRKVASRDIEAFRAWRSNDGLAPATVNKDVKQLKRLFNLASSRGYVQAGRNPCVGVPLLKVGEKRPAYMTPAHFELLYAEAATLIDQAVLMVLYTCGLRRSPRGRSAGCARGAAADRSGP